MKWVIIEELLSGMVLVKLVANTAELPVYGVGAELDNSMIDRLQQLRLNAVYVTGDARDTTEITLVELEAELERRFRQVLQDPLQALIFRHIRDHLQATYGIQE